MLTVTQLGGFGSGGSGNDATPNTLDFGDISSAGPDPLAVTNVVTLSGIDRPITLRLTLTSGMSGLRTVEAYRNDLLASWANSGTTLDVTVTNGQTLLYAFLNSQDGTTWNGIATLSNLSDGGAILDTFAYSLEDTGSDPVSPPVVVTF